LISSSCAITYYLAKNPRVQAKLQEELDEALGNEDDAIADYEQVKRLDYLQAVINEALRVHSTSAIGLPRLVPEGGLHVCGKFFPENTVLSVPSFTIHRDTMIWGDDAEYAYRPERFMERNQAEIQKAFNPFSYGPRYFVLAHYPLLLTDLDTPELALERTWPIWNCRSDSGAYYH
jgi:benzoate 4-monooxygenase